MGKHHPGLEGISHGCLDVSLHLTCKLCSQGAEENQPGTVPAVGFLLLGEANAFLPLFADNQIREFRRSLAELLLCAFSLAFVIWWLPPVLSHLAVRLCCTAQLLHR